MPTKIETSQKKPTKFKIKISDKYTLTELNAIASDVVDYIRERSEKGKAPGSNKKYSDSYARSLDFKIAGKSKNKVNQVLSGDMLTDLEVVDIKKGEVTVGYSDSNPEQGKAEGNIIGSYGGRPNKSKARNFIKLTKEEIKKILIDYPLKSTTPSSTKRERSTNANVRTTDPFGEPFIDPIMELEE